MAKIVFIALERGLIFLLRNYLIDNYREVVATVLMRTVLFLATNIAVLFVLGLLLNVLGMNQPDMDWKPFLVMTGIMRFSGFFISLMMAKCLSGAKVITSPVNDLK